jgi:hypothetical protein
MKVLQIEPATQKNKKYKALIIDEDGRRKWIHFGEAHSPQYEDRTELRLWSHLDHKDEKRRKSFHNRHGAYDGYAAQLSKRYLW